HASPEHCLCRNPPFCRKAPRQPAGNPSSRSRRLYPARSRLGARQAAAAQRREDAGAGPRPAGIPDARSEEHTSELQSRENLVCRLLLEKKKKRKIRKLT